MRFVPVRFVLNTSLKLTVFRAGIAGPSLTVKMTVLEVRDLMVERRLRERGWLYEQIEGALLQV